MHKISTGVVCVNGKHPRSLNVASMANLFLLSFFDPLYSFVLFCFVFSVIHNGVIAVLHVGVFILELLPNSYLDAYTEAIYFLKVTKY